MFQQVVLHVFHMLLPRMSKFYTWVMKNTFITLYPITLYVLKKNAMDIHGPNLSQINQVQYIIPKYDSQKCATRMLVRWDLPHLSRLSRVCSIFDLWVAQNDPPNIYIYYIPVIIPIVDDIPNIFHMIYIYICVCVLFFLPASESLIRPCAAATLHKRRLIYVHYISLCIPIVFPWSMVDDIPMIFP